MSIGKLILHNQISILSHFKVEIMCYNNLVVISPKHQLETSAGGSPHRQYKARPHYTREQLVNMSSKLKTCKYSILPFLAIETIRKLKINKRPSKLGSRFNNYTSKVNTKNLVHIHLGQDQTKTSNIRVGTVNTRSIKNKSDLIMEASKLENLDFLVISETWLKEQDAHWVATSSLATAEYRIQTINRQGKQGGGVALLHKNRYQVTRDHNAPQLDLVEYGIWSTRVRNKILTIAGLYHPPLGNTRNTPARFLDQVSQLVQYLFINHKNLVLLGDFNVHVNKLDNQDTQAYIDTMEALGLVQHIDQPTHQLGNTLDLIYTESLEPIPVSHGFTSNFISDHCLVGIELEIRKHQVRIESSKTRNYKNFNTSSFETSFNDSTILEQDNFEQAVKALEKELTRTLDELAPMQDRRKKKISSRPWYNSTLREQKRIVRNRERIYNRDRQLHQWKAFTRERNRYTRMLEFHKRHYLVTKVEEATTDSRQLFQLVGSLLGCKQENPLPEATSDSILAEEFASFFHEKIDNIRSRFINIAPYNPAEKCDMQLLTKFTPISSTQLGKTITRMSSKTCALDIIPSARLKEVLGPILPSLTHIVNKSIAKGEFYTNWKEALVKPLVKNRLLGSALSNYRPVSNLQFISKIVEKVTLDQFTQHCNTNRLLPDYQSAYRQHHSCETSLVKLVNDILWAMEKQLITVVVILDLSAAFDTVDHDLLLEVLESRFGVVGTASKWYTSYLKPRSFRVSIRNSTSQARQLDYSVPQGSIQGAYLFIAYASTLDLIVQPSGLELNGFADDHSIRTTFRPSKLDHREENDTIANIEATMLTVKTWMDQVRLKLNEAKTEFMYFGWPSQLGKCSTSTIDINGQNIARSEVTKYLGAHLDSALNFKKHIKTKCKAAMFNLQRIRAARKYLTISASNKLMVSLVISHLDYANGLLGGLPKSTIDQLQRVQNIAAKIVLGKGRYDSSTGCLGELHWLPIQYRIDFKIITLVYKSLHGLAPQYLTNLLTRKVQHREGLRSNDRTSQLEIPHTTRKTFAARAFSVLGPELWNRLPPNIQHIQSYITFKKTLKTYLYSKVFNGIVGLAN